MFLAQGLLFGAKALRRDGEHVLFRRAADRDAGNVLVVATASDQPAPRSLERLKHEYALRDNLDSDWAAKPLTLAHEHGHSLLVLADPGGELLSGLLDRRWETGAFLRVAIGMAAALGRVHAQGLIHKDVKPDHALVDLATGAAWLTGFGIASRLARERQAPDLPEKIAGTLAYMAPEQTGRMNRSVDARSDLYSLGVTFYQMLTAELPFTAIDPMELVHCHIARQPAPPNERVPEIPTALSAIVAKLLAKTAEERYQTAAGVASDLKRCLVEWEAGGSVEDIVLGTDDRSDRLLIPEKLYGREREFDTLLATFERVVRGSPPELVLVSGYSGIGKSSLVNELQKALVPPRGLFASGKFDQYKRDIPYSTLAQAFQTLVRGLLAKSDADLAPWRDALREALGPNGRLLTELVPELTLIIGAQSPVPELLPQDARGRFQLVFRRFIGVFARPEHPLALFLDDLQWLDAATLDLVQDLLTRSDLHHLLVIGAYRDHEVTSTHPLLRSLDAVRNAGTAVHHLVLAPLARDDLGRLVADSLHCDRWAADALAELVQERTAGNPFFVIQFLSALAEEGLLTFDHGAAQWSWDPARIHAKGHTDNVVDLMIDKLSRLPLDTQEALQQLACLGNRADAARLEMVQEGSMQDLYGGLQDALRTGLVLSSDDSYRFLHDRVQEAAYSLIPEDQRAKAHLRIGRLLAARTPPDERDEGIFEIVNQLNRGAALINARNEKEQLAQFNLIAGKRAKASTAYVSALRYLVAGTELLADDGWDLRPDLMLALELHRAECEFLTGELPAAEERLAALVARATATIDQAAVACLRIDLYTTLNRSDLAVDVCLQYLRHLGVEWSPHPTEGEARREYEQTWSLLGSREIEELITLPLMSDPARLATMDVMSKAIAPALFTDANLLCLTTCRMVNLSLQQGHCDASCFAYVWLGMVAGARFGNYKDGFRFGQLGYDLIQHRGLNLFEARTYMCFAQFVVPWIQHARMSRDLLRRALEIASKTGDLTYAAYTCNVLNTYLIVTAEPLSDLQVEAEKGLELVRSMGFGLVIDIVSTQCALIRTLRGMTSRFGSFSEAGFDESEFERRLAGDPMLAIAECWYWIRKLQAHVYAGDFSSAVDASLRAEPLLWTSPSFFEVAEYHFYSAIARAGACAVPTSEQDQAAFAALVLHHQRLEKWAENCPENFEDRAMLVGAEIARLEGRELDAMKLYERAINSARTNGFVHNEALAYELAARFHSARAFREVAALYLRKARSAYLRWGADGKVRQLDEGYPGIREEETAIPPTGTIGASVEGLDLATVIKVSQALSGEIVLEKMLDTLMRIAIEHAGAGRGLLMLARPGEHWIVAQVAADGDTVAVQMGNQPVAAGSLPQSVFHYVLRTHESVILDDAAARGPFASDPYIREQRARSVLCLPLLKQATLVGVLYLENRLAASAFTPARIAVLNLIASQAAIALENAHLYADLQKAHRLEAMGTLAGGIAHDFNNILGAILGYSEMALRDVTEGTRLRRDLEAIMTAGERGRALVERVLAFSRSGVAERVAVHVEKVVHEALDQLAAQLPDTVRLDAVLCAGEAALLGDATQVHQVVMNLGTNAAQAMPDGGVLTVILRLERFATSHSVTIGAVEKDEYIVLAVTDTGSGIPAHIVERIFDPFFTTKETGSGTGLGLSLVHGIVTQLGGAIDVASVVSKGSTFTVYLPRSGDVAQPLGTVESALPRGDGQRVLVIDDEEPLVKLAARILEELDYVPVCFTSGVEALAAIRDDPVCFDAIITDERMPDLLGCALAGEVRRFRREVPILLMSGYVGGGLLERAREAGVDDVLKKPLSARDLAVGLARVFQKQEICFGAATPPPGS